MRERAYLTCSFLTEILPNAASIWSWKLSLSIAYKTMYSNSVLPEDCRILSQNSRLFSNPLILFAAKMPIACSAILTVAASSLFPRIAVPNSLVTFYVMLCEMVSAASAAAHTLSKSTSCPRSDANFTYFLLTSLIFWISSTSSPCKMIRAHSGISVPYAARQKLLD